MRVPSRNVFLLLLATLFVAACSDSRTTIQPTTLDPGDRFPEVFPSQVTDLAVHAVNHRAVELSWTEVDDGKGEPVQYQVRLVSGSGS